MLTSSVIFWYPKIPDPQHMKDNVDRWPERLARLNNPNTDTPSLEHDMFLGIDYG